MKESDRRKVSEGSRKRVSALYTLAAILFAWALVAVNAFAEVRTSEFLVIVAWLALAGFVGGSILFWVGAIMRGSNRAGLVSTCIVLVSASVFGSSAMSFVTTVFGL